MAKIKASLSHHEEEIGRIPLHRLAPEARDIFYRLRLLPSLRYQYISPAVTRILGYTPEEFYADPDLIFNTVHPDYRRQME